MSRYTPSPDGYNIHRDTVALGFWKRRIALKNPLYITTSDKLGDQIKARRKKLGLLQREVAMKIGVCEDAVRFWESGLTEPGIAQMPGVLAFLGQPQKPPGFESWGEEVKWQRRLRGLSQHKMAQLLGTNERTIYDWENNKHRPFRSTMERVKALFERT